MDNTNSKNVEVVKEYETDQVALMPQEIDSIAVIRRIEAITRSIDGAVKVSLQRTNSSDWVAMGGKYYLQASGCQKIRAVWGIYFRDKEVLKEDRPDGSYSYYVTGLVGSQLLDRFYGKEITVEADGGRSSNDPFFTKGNRQADPMDIRKAAVSNFEARAISSFLGLKNFTKEDLERNGIKTSQVATVDYQKGAEGGGNTAVISEAQAKRLFAIANSVGVKQEDLKAFLQKRYQVDTSAKILRKDYEEICNAVQSGSLPMKTQEELPTIQIGGK